MKLFIPAEYMRTKNYYSFSSCPITCALADAGRSDLKDYGLSIEDDKRNVFISAMDPVYAQLVDRVIDMCHGKIPIKDITVELNIK
jgi:hypothetical protein